VSLPDGVHFKASEFACHDEARTPYPEEWADRWHLLVGMCDAIREQWGDALYVVSGYRTPAHNAELLIRDAEMGSHQVASSSFHLSGQAADLRPSRADQVEPLLALVLRMHAAGELPTLGGCASYPKSSWVHCDTGKAPDGHLRRWQGV
jgi:uncharacterized protein YcbK (DUF882 family)